MKNKKRILLILIILVIILILTLVFIKIYNTQEMAQKRYGYEIQAIYKDENEEIIEEKNIRFINVEALMGFKGELPVSTMTKRIKQVFLEKIPDYIEKTKNFTAEEIATYYDNNPRQIAIDLNIIEKESFINMIEGIMSVKSDLKTEFETCEFQKGTENVFVKFTYLNNEVIEFEIVGNSSKNFSLNFK